MKIGASYVMTVDSDDCINNKICEVVCKDSTGSNSVRFVKKVSFILKTKEIGFLTLKKSHTLIGHLWCVYKTRIYRFNCLI